MTIRLMTRQIGGYMLLVIDIGNTNTVLGVYDGKVLVDHWRIRTEKGEDG